MAARPSGSANRIQLKGALTGVVRLSSRAKWMIFLAGLMMLSFVILSIFSIDQQRKGSADSSDNRSEWDADTDMTNIQPAQPAFEKIGGLDHNGRAPERHAAPLSAPSEAIEQVHVAPLPSSFTLEKSVYAQNEMQAQKDRRQQSAIQSGLEMPGSNSDAPALAQRFEPPHENDMDALRRAQSERIDAALAAATRAAQSPYSARASASVLQDSDPNKQGHKEHFLHEKRWNPETFLKAVKQPPISPFELKAGWVIPAALECGLNSDLPGQTCARVTENVYDTATGRAVLIPQGTKVIGTYDSRIAYGQQRILVVWHRLIFPDASSISLNGMPGTDKAGHAGFDADIDRHTLNVFGNALLMAVFSAGIEHTQRRSAGTERALDSELQALSQSVGQQLGNTGSTMIRRGMNVQPTLTRPPGYTFNIVATRDIVFPGAYGMSSVEMSQDF